MGATDLFNTAALGWETSPQCVFSSNGYQTNAYKEKPAYCHEKNKAYLDALISVDVVVGNGGSAGLLFRDQFFYNNTGAYFFEIGSDGRYKISTVPYSWLRHWCQRVNDSPAGTFSLVVILCVKSPQRRLCNGKTFLPLDS